MQLALSRPHLQGLLSVCVVLARLDSRGNILSESLGLAGVGNQEKDRRKGLFLASPLWFPVWLQMLALRVMVVRRCLSESFR